MTKKKETKTSQRTRRGAVIKKKKEAKTRKSELKLKSRKKSSQTMRKCLW